MVLSSLFASLMALCSWLSIPLPPVAFTLQTFGLLLTLGVLGGKWGSISTALYLLLGLVGLPVFSGFSGGFQKLIGVTGGYLIGYLPCALITGLAVTPNSPETGPQWKLPTFMVLGTAVLYLIGTAWFMIQTKNTLAASMSMCVIPFLPGDAVKIVAASLLARPVRKALYRG
jgi:biotin transport system substrate-specific component